MTIFLYVAAAAVVAVPLISFSYGAYIAADRKRPPPAEVVHDALKKSPLRETPSVSTIHLWSAKNRRRVMHWAYDPLHRKRPGFLKEWD